MEIFNVKLRLASSLGGVEYSIYTFDLDPPNLPGDIRSVGVDPGVRCGVVLLNTGYYGADGAAVQMKFPSVSRGKSRVSRLVSMYNSMSVDGILGPFITGDEIVVVEDAAFHRKFGQAKLGEHRAAFALGLLGYVDPGNMYFVNPKSIWLSVLGSAKEAPKHIFANSGLPLDCCDAAVAAVYARDIVG